jgi:tetratricopeptide (TPR) repeat protein
LVAVHAGRWNPPALFAAVSSALDGEPALDRARLALSAPEVEDTRKLGLVAELLRRKRLLLVLDDFEQKLTPAGEAFADPGFAELFAGLCEATVRGRFLVTSRYPPPEPVVSMLLRVAMPPLSRSELGRLFLRLPALRDLDAEERRAVSGAIGGHPRLIEFVDALLRGGRANLHDVAAKLRDLAREHGVSLAPARSAAEAITDALLLGSRDILLETLTADERELVLQAAVSREPFSVRELTIARWGPDVGEDQAIATARAAERLVDLTLMTPSVDGELAVHGWVAESLAAYQGADQTIRHDRAAEMRLGRTRAGTWSFGDLVEIARHRAGAGRSDDLISFALAACDALRGTVSVAAYLGEVMPLVAPATARYLQLADRELQALLASGSTGAALQRAKVIVDFAASRAEADPGSADAQRDLSVSHERLGELMVRMGNGPEAERLYRLSLAIRERLAQADPGSADAQRDLSVSHEKLGDLMVRVGNGPEAERLYRLSLAIAERLAEADPGSAAAQRDLSFSYTTLGDLERDGGRVGEAERRYRDALAIDRRLALGDPSNVTAQADLDVSYQRAR